MKSSDSETHNQRVHTRSLSMTKLGDGLVDPKLVLSWLLTSLGAGAFWIGLLVPVREAGALLPQLFTASRLRRFAVRKWWWVTGSVVQGLMVLGITISAVLLEGAAAGVAIVACLAVFALARSICSVSYKDVLGKTIEKSSRGLITGTASSIAAAGVFVFGLLLAFEIIERQTLVIGALCLASLLWFVAAWRFSQLQEIPSEIVPLTSESVSKLYLRYLLEDRELQKFLVVRGLLVATAVAPPFLLLLSEQNDGGILAQLGGLVLASSLATFVSGRVWGRLSDRSTPLVLAFAGLASAAFLASALAGAWFGMYENVWFLPAVLFGLMVSYQGVRIARGIHLVNLANEDTRAAYTAISNTIIGVILLGSGVFGLLAEASGVMVVVQILLVMSLAGGLMSFLLSKP